MHKALSWVSIAPLLLIFLAAIPTAPVLADCPPRDVSYKVYDYGCGTWDWEFVAGAPDGEHDEGTFTNYGFCGGGFTECNCTFLRQYSAEGHAFFVYQDNGDGTDDFWWNITDWDDPSYSSCTSGACQTDGEVENEHYYSEPYQGYDAAWCYP